MAMREVERTRRVSELIRRELSGLLAREVDDRRVRMVSITGVRVSKDLKQAVVHVSGMEESADPAEIEKALNHAAKYLRYLLGKQLEMKSTPGLLFRYDHSIQRGMEMSQLIDSLANKHDARRP
ncbi:MAG: 30S ribosome-binding factor RbfA [Gammaproteobacteria bacterium]